MRNGNRFFGARRQAIAWIVACTLAAANGAALQASGQKTRTLRREEVLAAIDRALRTNGSHTAGELTTADVQLAAKVNVTEAAPKLQVTQIQTSEDGATSRVLVWVASEPRVPPFWVRLDRAIHLRDSEDSAERKTVSDTGMLVTAPEPRASAIIPVSEHTTMAEPRSGNTVRAVLVKAGDPVALVVEVGGLRIQGIGIPLGRGKRGDEVRVRAEPSGKIVLGTVISGQTVQVSF